MDILLSVGTFLASAPAVLGTPITMAVLSACGVLAATFGALTLRRPSLIEARLGSLAPAPRSLEEMELGLSFRERVLGPLVSALARLVLRYTPGSTLDAYKRKLVLAGGSGAEVRDLLGAKGLLAIGFAAVYALFGGTLGILPSPLIGTIGLALIGYRIPDMQLSRRIKARQNLIQRALPDALDLLTICVEAGLGFDAAISRLVDKRDDELSREFGRMLTEMRMGRSRREALRSLADRTDVPDVNTFISAIIQSEQLGVSISKVLLTQAAQMRVRRRQRAEELAQKAPIKMLFPMVFLIFPAMFVVILGPAIPAILAGFK